MLKLIFNLFKKEQEPNWNLINADLKSKATAQDQQKQLTNHYGNVKAGE